MFHIRTYLGQISFAAKIVALILALVPLFNYNIGGTGLFMYLGGALLIASPFMKHKMIIRGEYGFLAIFILYDLLSFLWSPNTSDFFQYIKIYIIVFLILYLIIGNNDARHILNLQVLMGLVLIVYLCVTTNTLTVEGDYLYDTQRAAIRYNDVQIDPNYASMLLFPVSVFLFRYIFETGNKIIWRIIAIALLFMQLYAFFRSGSRGGLFAIGVGMIYYAIKTGVSAAKTFAIICIVIVGSISLPLLLSSLSSEVATRFSLDFINDQGTSGRSEYWFFCLSHVFDDPFTFVLGHGKSATITDLGIASHNFFVDCIYNGGIIQLIILICFYIKLYKTQIANNNIFAQTLLVSYVMMTMSVSVGANMYYWAGILLLVFVSQYTEEELSLKK